MSCRMRRPPPSSKLMTAQPGTQVRAGGLRQWLLLQVVSCGVLPSSSGLAAATAEASATLSRKPDAAERLDSQVAVGETVILLTHPLHPY